MHNEMPNRLKHITGRHLFILWVALSVSIVVNWWLFSDQSTQDVIEVIHSIFDMGFAYAVLYGAMRWVWK